MVKTKVGKEKGCKGKKGAKRKGERVVKRKSGKYKGWERQKVVKRKGERV